MSEEKTVTACLILIGNEILSGRTQDVPLRSGDIVQVPSLQQGDSVVLINARRRLDGL